jgi:hypothetical protein
MVDIKKGLSKLRDSPFFQVPDEGIFNLCNSQRLHFTYKIFPSNSV